MARRPESLAGVVGSVTEVIGGDVIEPDSLTPVLRGVDTAFYLVHALVE